MYTSFKENVLGKKKGGGVGILFPNNFVCTCSTASSVSTPGEVGLDPTPGEVGLDPTPGEVSLDPTPGEVSLDPTPGEVSLESNAGEVGRDSSFCFRGRPILT